ADRILQRLHDAVPRRPDPHRHARRSGRLQARRRGGHIHRRSWLSGEHDCTLRPTTHFGAACADRPSYRYETPTTMNIPHLINGQTVTSRTSFETINPATQEVLAEVAAGGEAEVNAAVQAAKDAFPKWAGLPATERARLMRRLGELIAKHVPEIAQTETNDSGQVIAQTGKQLIPRAADNFHYFAEMCTRVDGHTYPTPTHLNYTLFHPVGVCALISPW